MFVEEEVGRRLRWWWKRLRRTEVEEVDVEVLVEGFGGGRGGRAAMLRGGGCVVVLWRGQRKDMREGKWGWKDAFKMGWSNGLRGLMPRNLLIADAQSM